MSIFCRKGGKRRRTMRGGYGQVGRYLFTGEGGRKRRTMRGGQKILREGGRKRSMRGGQFTSMSRIDNGGKVGLGWVD